MPSSPETWCVRYPRRTPHPRRPRVRLDAAERAAATGSSSNLLFAMRGGSQPAHTSREGGPQPVHSSRGGPRSAHSSTGGGRSAHASRHPHSHRAKGSETARGSMGRLVGGAGGDIPTVRFNSVVKLILVPSRNDLHGLSTDLWWREEDYAQFRLGAVVEGNVSVLRRSLRIHSSPMETIRIKQVHPRPAEIAQALEVAGNGVGDGGNGGGSGGGAAGGGGSGGGVRPSRKLKFSSPPLGSAQPRTPPCSPVNDGSSSKEGGVRPRLMGGGCGKELGGEGGSHVEDFSARLMKGRGGHWKDEPAYAEDFGGFVILADLV